jgi:hypothetical protein
MPSIPGRIAASASASVATFIGEASAQTDTSTTRRPSSASDTGLEARVAERGGECVVRDIVAQRAVRIDRADAAAQLAIEAKRHEAGTALGEPRFRPRLPRRGRLATRDRLARDADESRGAVDDFNHVAAP